MRLLPFLVGATASAILAEAAAAAPQLLAREQAPFTAAAARGAVAWSAFDPASGRYRLKVLRGGTITTPAIADRGRPFDVDLGRLAGAPWAPSTRAAPTTRPCAGATCTSTTSTLRRSAG